MRILRRLSIALVILGAVIGLVNVGTHAVFGLNAFWVAFAALRGQDLKLNHLEHLPGYAAAPLGSLGEVEQIGSGPRDLIFVAGLGFEHGWFREFFDHMGDTFTIHAVKLAGFGDSAAPPMPGDGVSYSEQTWIRSAEAGIVDLIEDRGLEQPIMIGHFLIGSQIALRLAVDHPDKIGGAIAIGGEAYRYLEGSFGGGALDPVRRIKEVDEVWAPQWFKHVTRETWESGLFPADVFARSPEIARQLWQQTASVPIPISVRYLCEYMATDMRGELEGVKVPVLVIRPGFSPEYLEGQAGAFYRMAFLRSWTGLAEKNNRIRIETVPGARVFVPLDEPEASQKLIVEFADRVKAALATGVRATGEPQ